MKKNIYISVTIICLISYFFIIFNNISKNNDIPIYTPCKNENIHNDINNSMLKKNEVDFSAFVTKLTDAEIEKHLLKIKQDKLKKYQSVVNTNNSNLNNSTPSDKIETSLTNRELLAKMLYCEAGATSYKCQVYVCSAIVNLINYNNGNYSILDSTRYFDPASWYRNVTPSSVQFNVVDSVLSGNIVPEIKYFRDSHYHNFGVPVICIDNVYFSK